MRPSEPFIQEPATLSPNGFAEKKSTQAATAAGSLIVLLCKSYTYTMNGFPGQVCNLCVQREKALNLMAVVLMDVSYVKVVLTWTIMCSLYF